MFSKRTMAYECLQNAMKHMSSPRLVYDLVIDDVTSLIEVKYEIISFNLKTV